MLEPGSGPDLGVLHWVLICLFDPHKEMGVSGGPPLTS